MKKLTDKEITFLEQTIFALLSTGARIGKQHYTTTITRSELWDIHDKITAELRSRKLIK